MASVVSSIVLTVTPFKPQASATFAKLNSGSSSVPTKLLSPLNKLWMRFGLLLGRIVSPIIMGIIYFFVVTPTGLIMKIFRKDLLSLKKNDEKSYWIEKNDEKSNMKHEF